jgi:hypothetical protein
VGVEFDLAAAGFNVAAAKFDSAEFHFGASRLDSTMTNSYL